MNGLLALLGTNRGTRGPGRVLFHEAAMLKSEVRLGGVYRVRLHGVTTDVRLEREAKPRGWFATNLRTNREVRIRSASKLRLEVLPVVVHDFKSMAAGERDECE